MITVCCFNSYSHFFTDINQMDESSGGRICRFVTYDFPQYFAVVSRIRQEVHAIGPEGGMVSSTVVPQVQAVFPQGALTKKIKVGLQVNSFVYTSCSLFLQLSFSCNRNTLCFEHFLFTISFSPLFSTLHRTVFIHTQWKMKN